jgi:hypothetical protein
LIRPIEGDHVTLFTFQQAQPWLRCSESTIRRMIKNGEIPHRFLTHIGGNGGGRGRKVFMSGDQIVGLLAHWRDRTQTPAPIGAPRRRRSSRAAA